MMKNIENNNTTVKMWKKDFSETMSNRIGFPLEIERICSDENGYHYHIKPKSLSANSPLLLMHYNAKLIAVIPYKEYERLENGEIAPYEYIDKARWNYGRYWCWEKDGKITNLFWMPIEKKDGIHEKAKISRYLKILSCRTTFEVGRELPSEEKCKNCSVQNCPFSPFAEKNEGSDWSKEVQERDYREDFFKAVRERVENEFGLEVIEFYSHDATTSLLLMPPAVCTTSRDQVMVYMPAMVLNYILYHPSYRNWKQYAKSYTFELGVVNKEERFRIPNEMADATEYVKEKIEILCAEPEVVVEEKSDDHASSETTMKVEDSEDMGSQTVSETDFTESEGKNLQQKHGFLKKMKNLLLKRK